MDFADDEDFLLRVDQEENFMDMDAGSLQPYEEMLPPEEEDVPAEAAIHA